MLGLHRSHSGTEWTNPSLISIQHRQVTHLGGESARRESVSGAPGTSWAVGAIDQSGSGRQKEDRDGDDGECGSPGRVRREAAADETFVERHLDDERNSTTAQQISMAHARVMRAARRTRGFPNLQQKRLQYRRCSCRRTPSSRPGMEQTSLPGCR